ncbi:protein-L-isoaspartate(D-aspartate) O-methyltransferase [Polyangium sp. 6x1]|uniref:protein-L-isoaspartate(D-aspartate) O-methyltransferase n=1 Tax=Polyangium sp. 6x1 TaxID=3042689 RepID=UPI0024829BD0|nr:protein-L-isoaspartate(D-aspartate) O-methyltransferase [Polyangium sp. 6x1]MDI1450627.1 protein-L-isoaspartate(D-aspartate) O-methyltransferase [Polyangium sp. 6x1]
MTSRTKGARHDDCVAHTRAMDPMEQARHRMVDEQLARRGIHDARVLEAMRRVPRHAFVPAGREHEAYLDRPLPIAESQTISQPYIVALTAQALRIGPDARVLEIGAGSGYAAAVLAELAREVVTVERHPPLAAEAAARLASLRYGNIQVVTGDGTRGYPERAPYDAIAVTASGPRVPKALLDQLAPGGRLVIPVGPDEHRQELVLVTRGQDDGAFSEQILGAVRFVLLVGEDGWARTDGA